MNEVVKRQHYGDLMVGARGYRHTHWQDSFYPEDIPDDWRLDYYANEFNVLLLPWTQWRDHVEQLATELDDIDEDFHLYLELPTPGHELPDLARIAGKVSGLVCMEGEPGAWQEAASASGISLLAETPVDATFRAFRAVGDPDGPVQLALLNTQAAGIDDLMAMRGEVEKALPLMGERMDLVLTDAQPDTEAMRNTRTLAELLGA